MQFGQLKRREFITRLGGVAAWPLAARAQSKVARIGALYIGLADAESFKKELREGFRELGYVEGQNITFEFRSAEGKLERLPELASELVRLKVDVIVALYVPCALAAKHATREIPIVIVAADPVETGIVASLARPGGNITGVSLMSAVLVAKCVELFRDMLAATRRVAVRSRSCGVLASASAVKSASAKGARATPSAIPSLWLWRSGYIGRSRRAGACRCGRSRPSWQPKAS
jgi:putative tryptophan/tyrosine transport system substrate-binding protein